MKVERILFNINLQLLFATIRKYRILEPLAFNQGLDGRMLEVKNMYNRDINGIPKEEYWIQMQIQLETCNLECCDFRNAFLRI